MSQDEDVESNWKEVESPVQDPDERKDGNEGKSPGPLLEDATVSLKVPICCAECEETVTIALKNVAGNQPLRGYQSSDNYRCLLTLVGIVTVIGIIVVLTTTTLHAT